MGLIVYFHDGWLSRPTFSTLKFCDNSRGDHSRAALCGQGFVDTVRRCFERVLGEGCPETSFCYGFERDSL